MPETTPLIKAALNLRVGAGFDVYFLTLTQNTNSNSNSEQQLKTIIQNINSKISFSFNHLMTQLCVGYFKIYVTNYCFIEVENTISSKK